MGDLEVFMRGSHQVCARDYLWARKDRFDSSSPFRRELTEIRLPSRLQTPRTMHPRTLENQD
jgi:hypothetical protein